MLSKLHIIYRIAYYIILRIKKLIGFFCLGLHSRQMTYRKISLTLKEIPISEYFIKIYNLGMKLCFEVTTSKSMEKTICRKTPIPSKYFDVPSRISMLFRLISKTNISKRCLMTLTDETHLKGWYKYGLLNKRFNVYIFIFS